MNTTPITMRGAMLIELHAMSAAAPTAITIPTTRARCSRCPLEMPSGQSGHHRGTATVSKVIRPRVEARRQPGHVLPSGKKVSKSDGKAVNAGSLFRS
jgi:hypothetical protein